MTTLGVYPPDIPPARDHRDFIAFTNGVLDIRRFLAGEPYFFQPHTPHWFANICLPYPFDAVADCPTWKNVLAENLEGDHQRTALLQEWAGYLLLPDTSHQRFLILEGEGANGKSVYCAGLHAMLSDEAVSHIPLEIFGQRFALTETLSRLVNIAADCGDIDRVAEGHLKSFTSGDRMFFDRKGLAGVSAIPTARLMLACNNRPRFSDRSGGLWRRMLLCPFLYTIPESRRIIGMDKAAWWAASGELPGIFCWAMAGLYRLRQQGCFTLPQICLNALADYREEVNPARAFLREFCEPNSMASADAKSLYRHYRDWCAESGYKPLGDRQFGKEVRRSFPQIKRAQAGTGKNKMWIYLNLLHSFPSEV